MNVPGSRYRALLVVIAGFHTLFLCDSAICHSPTIDEGGHILSGLTYWKTGRFYLYTVNPPLAKLWSSWPIALAGAVVPYQLDVSVDQSWDDDHSLFVEHNRELYPHYVLLARLMLVPIAIVGLLTVAAWARQLFGQAAGLLAGLLWATNPGILAWGSVANADLPAAVAAVVTMFCFAKWLEAPDWNRALGFGLILGMAQITKFSLILLYPCCVLIVVAMRLLYRDRNQPDLVPGFKQLTAAIAISIVPINAAYGFDSVGSRFEELPLHSRTLSKLRDTAPWLRLPIPDGLILGIDEQKSHADAGYRCYLRGRWYERGFVYYYAYAALIKEPLPLIAALLLSCGMRWARREKGRFWRDEAPIFLPIVVIGGVLSAQTGLNAHYRYVLPVLPFVFILAGSGVSGCHPGRNRRVLKSVFAIVAFWSVLSIVSANRNYIGYFNELVGGSRFGKSHLAESNVDWGQDLYFLRNWMESHSDSGPLGLAYYGPVDPALLGVSSCFSGDELGLFCRSIDGNCGWCRHTPRYLAISANFLCGYPSTVSTPRGEVSIPGGSLSSWRDRQPAFTIGSSIYVYDLAKARSADSTGH